MRVSLLAPLALSGAVLLAGACSGQAFTTSEGDGDGDGDTSSGGDETGSGGAGESGGASSGGDGSGASGGTDGSGGTGTGGSSVIQNLCFTTLDCELVPNTCCASCERPRPEMMMAITKGQDQIVQQELCGDTPPPCPACVAVRNPNLFAQCIDGTCQVQDLRTHEDAQCGVDDDCFVTPAACCACGAGSEPDEIVAAGQDPSHFREAQCEVTTVCGNDCAWLPPPETSASCNGGFCALDPPPAMP